MTGAPTPWEPMPRSVQTPATAALHCFRALRLAVAQCAADRTIAEDHRQTRIDRDHAILREHRRTEAIGCMLAQMERMPITVGSERLTLMEFLEAAVREVTLIEAEGAAEAQPRAVRHG